MYADRCHRKSQDPREPERSLRALGEALRRTRERRHMTREQLSRASGVRERAIARMEEGRLDPSFDLLLELAEVLGTRPSALIIYAERIAIAEAVAPDEQ